MPGVGRKLAISLLFAGAFLGAREYGPAIGSKLPAFDLPDQDGKTHSLASLIGPKGAVIVFFRSADW
jgi:hypothetical protein